MSDEYCYIILDRHYDWGRDMHTFDCGSFVSRIYQDTHTRQKKSNIVIVGTDSSVEPPIPGQDVPIEQLRHNPKSLEWLLRNAAKDAYVSVDLDVTHPSAVRTAYDRGGMMADELFEVLGAIRRMKNIIGAYVLGYTESGWPCSAYAGEALDKDGQVCIPWKHYGIYAPPSFEQSMKVYKSIVEIITGRE